METKLIAAEIATAAGVSTVICSSKYPENIFGIIEYNDALRNAAAATPLATHEELAPLSVEDRTQTQLEPRTPTATPPRPRPLPLR